MYIILGIFGFLVIVFIVVVWSISFIRKYIPDLDCFSLFHNYQPGHNMTVRKTFLGGLFYTLFVIIALYLLSNQINLIYTDNYFENKALIPSVVLNETYPEILSDIEF